MVDPKSIILRPRKDLEKFVQVCKFFCAHPTDIGPQPRGERGWKSLTPRFLRDFIGYGILSFCHSPTVNARIKMSSPWLGRLASLVSFVCGVCMCARVCV